MDSVLYKSPGKYSSLNSNTAVCFVWKLLYHTVSLYIADWEFEIFIVFVLISSTKSHFSIYISAFSDSGLSSAFKETLS